MLARFYMRLLKYRKDQKDQTIKWMIESKPFGLFLLGTSQLLMNGNIVFQAYWNAGNASSKFGDALYYGLSRVTFITGAAMLIMCMLTGHANYAKEFFSKTWFRYFAHALPIFCVMQILIIECLFDSNSTPDGIYLTYWTCLLFGLGFQLCSTFWGFQAL